MAAYTFFSRTDTAPKRRANEYATFHPNDSHGNAHVYIPDYIAVDKRR